MSAAGFQPPARSAAVSLLSAVISAFRWAILALILLLLAPYALAQFDNAARYAATNQAIAARNYVVNAFSSRFGQYIPTRIAGRDRTDWILIGGLRRLRPCRRLAPAQSPASVCAAANAQAGRGLATADAHPGEFGRRT